MSIDKIRTRLLGLSSAFALTLLACGSPNEGIEGAQDPTQPTTTIGAKPTEPTDNEPSSPPPLKSELPFTCNNTTKLKTSKLYQNWDVAGRKRTFYLDLPKVDANTPPVAVIFAWHGVDMSGYSMGGGGDPTAMLTQWRQAIFVDPNTDNDFPFILVTPDDLNLVPLGFPPFIAASDPVGLDWDMFESVRNDNNLEGALFEQILACLNEQFNIDTTRIYQAGFSGGAIIANMIHSRYPEYVAGVFSGSGAWFNDPKQLQYINLGNMNINIEWEPLDAADHGAIFLTYGNDKHANQDQIDHFPMQGAQQVEQMLGIPNGEIINFGSANRAALEFLPQYNRTVIGCAHNYGHTGHPQISVSMFFQFFKDHQAGQPSPYLGTGLPDIFKNAGCQLYAPLP